MPSGAAAGSTTARRPGVKPPTSRTRLSVKAKLRPPGNELAEWHQMHLVVPEWRNTGRSHEVSGVAVAARCGPANRVENDLDVELESHLLDDLTIAGVGLQIVGNGAFGPQHDICALDRGLCGHCPHPFGYLPSLARGPTFPRASYRVGSPRLLIGLAAAAGIGAAAIASTRATPAATRRTPADFLVSRRARPQRPPPRPQHTSRARTRPTPTTKPSSTASRRMRRRSRSR